MMVRKLVLVTGERIECADRGADSSLVELPHGVMLRYLDAANRSTGQWDVYPWPQVVSWGRHRYYPQRVRPARKGGVLRAQLPLQ